MKRRLMRFRLAVLKIHRRAGIAVVLFAIFLTVTGVLINHCNALGWDKHRLASAFWLNLYGVTPSGVVDGYPLSGHWLTQASDTLYFDEQVLAHCAAPLSGVVSLAGVDGNEEGGVALCQDGVVLFTPDGQLIERMPLSGASRQGLAVTAGVIVAHAGEGLVRLDTVTGAWATVASVPETLVWSHPEKLPAALSDALRFLNVPEDLTWERLLLDLHSGRLFGNIGVLVVDFMGLLMMSLALTGLWVALTRKR